MNNQYDIIQFIHVAKAAGSSVRSSILSNFATKEYPKVFTSLFIDWKKIILDPTKVLLLSSRSKLMFMHLPFRVKPFFGDESGNPLRIYYATFLREPIRRTLESLQHILIIAPIKTSPIYHYWKHNKDFTKFLQMCLQQEVCCNVMCKQLSGIDNILNCVCTEKEISYGEIYSPRHQSIRKYTDQEMDHLLKAAKFNLKNYFQFIGFQENFDNSMNDFCSQLNLKRDHNRETKNIFPDIPMFKLTNVDMKILWEMNKYDIKLYSYAQWIYEEKKI